MSGDGAQLDWRWRCRAGHGRARWARTRTGPEAGRRVGRRWGSRGVRGRPKASSENSRSARFALDRLARVRQVPGATDDLQPGVGEASQSAAVAERRDLVVSPWMTTPGSRAPAPTHAGPSGRGGCRPRAAAINVAGSVSRPQPIPSSIALLERGSANAARDEPLDVLGKVL